MSETFTQSTSPTAGLTNYDLEPKAKELYPAPMIGPRPIRNRHAAWRKRFLTRGGLKKESTMTQHTVEAMVDMLSKSVMSIVDSNATDRAALLAKTFTEFGQALNGQVDELAKAAQPEEPLFKGLGCVGAVANLVSTLANNIQDITNGGPSWKESAQKDPASEELVEHLEGLLMHAETILRMAVNEHCGPYEDGDDMDGMHLIMVPADGGGEVAVKSHLPEDLAKYATDPAAIDAMLADVGMHALGAAGVDTDALGKALEAGALAKDAGMMGGASAAPGDAGGADIGGGNDAGGLDDADPLDTMARLASLMLIVVDNMKQMVDGSNAPTDPTGENATGSADQPVPDATDVTATGAGNPSADDPTVNKSAPAGDLAKIDPASVSDDVLHKLMAAKGFDPDVLAKIAGENAELKSQVAEFEETTKELLKRAEPAKAPVLSDALLQKSTEDQLANATALPVEDLSKLSPTERALRLTKAAQRPENARPWKGN